MGIKKVSTVAAIMLALSAPHSALAKSAVLANDKPAKLPIIQGTYTPPKGVDWGCGVDMDVTVKGDGSRACPVKPYKGGK